jgi:hypothetical protein
MSLFRGERTRNTGSKVNSSLLSKLEGNLRLRFSQNHRSRRIERGKNSARQWRKPMIQPAPAWEIEKGQFNAELSEMFEKKWITNDRGQIEAIWVQRDRVSPADFVSKEENEWSGVESAKLSAAPLKDEAGIHAAFKELHVLRVTERQLMPIGPSKGGNWNKFYTILRSVLP